MGARAAQFAEEPSKDRQVLPQLPLFAKLFQKGLGLKMLTSVGPGPHDTANYSITSWSCGEAAIATMS